jgi:hypothetical protein
VAALGIVLADSVAGATRQDQPSWRRLAASPGVLVCAIYLVAAFAVNIRLWHHLGVAAPTGDPGPSDYYLMVWFVRYAATAVAHGHLPALVTQALNAPMGINLMWNNTILFPAVLFAPLTLLAGPVTTITVLTTLGFACSAAAMYWLLRQPLAGGRRVGVPAAALGGAVFGFSPGMVNASNAHYGMLLAAAVPLMIGTTLAILTGRGNPVRHGVWLGLLAAAQFFTGEELLVDAAFACLLLTIVLVASRPSAVAARVRGAVIGLGTAVGVTLVATSYGLWRQFHGPLVSHGTPWDMSTHGNGLSSFVQPQAGLLFHTASSAAYAVAHQADFSEYLSYLGWPLTVIALAATVAYWRDLRVRAASVAWLALEALSLGQNRPWMPLHWLVALPLLGDMLPSRLSLVADAGAAAVFAFALDRWLAPRREPRHAGAQASGLRRAPAGRRLRVLAGAALALLAVAPLVPRPVPTIAVAPLPAGWDATFAALRVPAGSSVLAVPLAWFEQSETMLWQAETSQPAELNAGWFLGPDPTGHAAPNAWGPPSTTLTVHCLNVLFVVKKPMAPRWESGCATDLRDVLAIWHSAAIVAPTAPGSPLAAFLTAQFGPPAVHDGQMLAWRLPAG